MPSEPDPPSLRAVVLHDDVRARRAVARALLAMPGHRARVQLAAAPDDALQGLRPARVDLLLAGHTAAPERALDLLERAARIAPHTKRILLQGDVAPLDTPPTCAHALARIPLDHDAFARLCAQLLEPAAPPEDARLRGAPRAQLNSELRRIDLELKRLRMQLATGGVSRDAHDRLARPLLERREVVQAAIAARPGRN